MKLTTDQLSFLARFARSPDGKVFVDILSGYLGSTDRALRSATGEEVFRQQGRAKQLEELANTIESAEATLTRIKPAVSQPPRLNSF